MPPINNNELRTKLNAEFTKLDVNKNGTLDKTEIEGSIWTEGTTRAEFVKTNLDNANLEYAKSQNFGMNLTPDEYTEAIYDPKTKKTTVTLTNGSTVSFSGFMQNGQVMRGDKAVTPDIAVNGNETVITGTNGVTFTGTNGADVINSENNNDLTVIGKDGNDSINSKKDFRSTIIPGNGEDNIAMDNTKESRLYSSEGTDTYNVKGSSYDTLFTQIFGEKRGNMDLTLELDHSGNPNFDLLAGYTSNFSAKQGLYDETGKYKPKS